MRDGIRTCPATEAEIETMLLLRQRYPNLTPAELRIAALIAHGLTTPQIATRFHCSVRTIENHRYRMGKKVGTRSGDGLGWVAELCEQIQS